MAKRDRTETNPLFNANKIKLGVFTINGSGGARTLVPEKFKLTWENSLDVAMAADEAGFEAIVPYQRWTSEAGPGHRSGSSYECLTWAAGIGARTSRSCVMSTTHVMHIHPAVAAKMISTIDHICNGRFAVNIVCGWVPDDMTMFGHADLGSEGRYGYADEWITLLKRLWSEPDSFDFRGRYIEMEGGYSEPKPIQFPFPGLMNAGGSEDGQAFVAKHCDIAFIRTENHERMRERAANYRRMVAEKYGREVQIWIQAYVVQRDSYDEAQAYLNHYAVEQADHAHIDATLKLRNIQLSSAEEAVYRRNLGAGPGGLPLLGNAEDIANEMLKLSSLGIDGFLMTWVDFHNGVRQFGREVIPLLERAGVRLPPSRTMPVARQPMSATS